MSRTTRIPTLWAGLAGVVAIGAVAGGLVTAAAQQQPQLQATGITTTTVKQAIGTPRIPLEVRAVPRLAPRVSVACAAPVDVNIAVNPATRGGGGNQPQTPPLPQKQPKKMSFNMRTEEKAVWYSLVDTIPPIGHTASITVNPVRLLEGNRKVGTLVSGEVKFREVVRDIPLNGPEAQNLQTVQALLRDLSTASDATLGKLAPISLPQYTLPAAGIQVMRARLEETYEIDGIGKDTVELTGWIAVRHGTPRAAMGATEVTWETAVLDTEFVGMNLKGTSDLFGDVVVTLDTTRPSHGQVGRIEIPELARYALLAKLQKDTVAEPPAAPAPKSSRREKK